MFETFFKVDTSSIPFLYLDSSEYTFVLKVKYFLESTEQSPWLIEVFCCKGLKGPGGGTHIYLGDGDYRLLLEP